jgi:hypothetical protein
MEVRMDEKPKKRPWFQFHLSTAVVLMFVAGGLLWANMQPPYVSVLGGDAWETKFQWSGWPIASEGEYDDYGRDMTCRKNGETNEEFSARVRLEAAERFDTALGAGVLHRYASWPELMLNLVINMGILFAVAFVCEQCIRYRPQEESAEKTLSKMEWLNRRKSAKAVPPKDGPN